VTPPDLATSLAALRALMAEERRAIAKLDIDALEQLMPRKHELLAALAALRDARDLDPALKRLIVAARIELGANAALLSAASEAVSAALGLEPPTGHGRSARAFVTTRPLRSIIAG